jgi:N-acyl-D-aspartate/D-glutamate deacylase
LTSDQGTAPGRNFDLIVRSGTVIDGTGGAGRRADIGISDGVIRAIGDLQQAGAAEEIDADGLIVTPGIVDVHSHSDLTLLVDGRAQSALAQGVTTELVGNCGHGCLPLRDKPEFAANIFGYDRSFELGWRSAAEYLARLEDGGPAINVGTLVPLGNLRLATMDDPESVASPEQRQAMRSLLEEALDEGALGFSSGLQYPDSVATLPEELADLTAAVASRGGLYSACVRHTDVRAVEGIAEPINTAASSGVRVQISHAMPMPGSPPGMTERTYELVDNGRSAGVDVAFDMHTRASGEVNLSAMLPLWALAGGTQEIGRRLSSAGERARIKEYPSYIRRFIDNPGPQDMVVVLTGDTSLVGKTLTELTPSGGDPLDTIMDILREEGDDIHRPLVLIKMYPEDELTKFYQHPFCAVMSDATALCLDGPLASAIFYGAFTWASWYLRRVVRERQDLSLPEAIRKVTSLPAERIGLKDRGTIREGARADIAMFDFDAVSDKGTLTSPNQLALGTVNVLVNGVPALRNGALTGARPGRVLRSGQ